MSLFSTVNEVEKKVRVGIIFKDLKRHVRTSVTNLSVEIK